MISTFVIATDLVRADFGITGFIVAAIIAAALSYGASILLAKEPDIRPPLEDDADSVAGTRGTLAPLLLGYNKVKPKIAYVGTRRTWNKKVGSVPDPDGFWEDDDDITQENFRESGMHILCVGPARSLYGIQKGGKVLFDQYITPITYPSGSQFTCLDEDRSTFRIYWGEPTQPIDSELALLTGVASRFPYCCYIFWDKMELGSSARWPSLEYIIDCATLDEESQFIDTSDDIGDSFSGTWYSGEGVGYLIVSPADLDKVSVGDTVTIASEGVTFGVYKIYDVLGSKWVRPTSLVTGLVHGTSYTAYAELAGTGRRGANPALIIRQLLFYGFPHGMALNRSLFDVTSLEDLIPYFAETGTEVSPATVYLKQGTSYQGAIAAILQDYGINMYPDAVTGKYSFSLIREGGTAVSLTNDYADMATAVDSKGYSVLAPEKTVYAFLEAERNFTTSTILVDDDGRVSQSENPNAKKIQLSTPTDVTTASMIAGRREQEAYIDRVIEVNVSSDKEEYNIGQLVEFEDVSGTWRLVAKKPDTESSYIKMTFALDNYSVTNNYTQYPSIGTQPLLESFPDIAVLVAEGNRYLDPNKNGYYIVRQRYHESIDRAWLYRSETDVTADFRSGSSVLDFNTIGSLNEAVAEDSSTLDSLEISVDASDGSDFLSIMDIEISEADWRNSKVMAYIGNEFLSIQSYTKIDDTTVTLDGVRRGRFGTSQPAHSINDQIGIFYKAQRTFIEDSIILNGETIYLRTRPATASNLTNLDDVESVELSYNGGGYRPLPPENLNTVNQSLAWITGDDVDLRWDYKNTTSQTGAGLGISDVPSEPDLPEGYFRVQILNGSTVVRAEEVLVASFTYTQTMMTADFGSEPSSFNVSVVEILNGLTSDEDTATITRV